MKKTLLAMEIILLVGLSFVLAGCGQPTDVTVTDSIQSIEGPGNVVVSAQPGALKVVWDLVADAESYEIRRKADVADARYEVVGSAKADENVFLDAISGDNILVDGTTYLYQVIAVSSASTRAVVQSGVTTSAAFAVPTGTFPARGDAGVVKAVTNVAAVIAPNGRVTISWDSTNTDPVTYTAVRYTNSSANPLPTTDDTYAYTNVTGEGYFRGAVSAVWPNDYYPGSDAVPIAEVKYAIPTVTLDTGSITFTAARDAGAEKVIVNWDPVFSATGYILQKYVWASTAASPSVIPADQWTDVTADQLVKADGDIYVEDTVPVDSSARYRLIVQTAKGTADPVSTAPSGSSTDVNPVSSTPYSVSLSVSSQPVTVDDSNNHLDTSRNAIVFTFSTKDPENKYTYSLYRQAVGETNGTGNEVKGDYELVPGIPEKFASAPGVANYGGGVVKQQYTPDLQRQQYNYKVRVYEGAAVYNDYEYSPSLPAKSSASGLFSYAYAATPPSGAANAETVWYLAYLTGELQSGETVYVYGRRDPNHPAPTQPAQNQPVNSTELIGTAQYYDGSTAYPYPTPSPATEVVPSSSSGSGYYVKGSYYFTNLSGEVK
jgi:hypothetical protein